MFHNYLHITSKINRLLKVNENPRVSTTSKKGENSSKLVWKKHFSKFSDIERYFLLNELKALSALQNFSPWKGPQFSVQVPKLSSQLVTDNAVEFSTVFFEGSKLTFSEPEVVKDVLNNILHFIQNIQEKVKPSAAPRIEKMNSFSLLVRGIFYGFKAAFRNLGLFIPILRSTLVFAYTYLPSLFSKMELSLAHRDLDSDNIMISQKNILLADWENAVFTDPLFDIAQIPRLYQEKLGIYAATDLCKVYLKSEAEKKRWKALVLFGTLQSLALDAKNSHMSRAAKITLKNFVPTKTLFEKLYTVAFATLGFIYKIFPFLYKPTDQAIILCYHNLGLNTWQYTTDNDEFDKQIQYFNSHFKISKLDTLMRTAKGLAITFDDGYQSLIEFALPTIKRFNKTATVFMVGNPDQRDIKELDNEFSFLSDKEVKLLEKENWEIGFHTATHPDVSKLSPAGLSKEITKGKQEFEKRIKLPTRYFAYPKGFYSEQVRSIVESSKFEAAFTVDDKPFDKRSNQYLISRISIEKTMSVNFLKALLTPTGLWLWSAFLSMLSVKEKLSRIIRPIINFANKVARFSKRSAVLWFALFCMLILLISLRGLKGSPTSYELNSNKWMDEGPMELSPERGRFALTYSLAEDHSFHFSLAIARFALPDVATAKGYFVSLFAPTVSYIVMPGYIIGKAFGYSQVGSFIVIALFAVFNAVLIRAIAIRLGARPSAATIAALLFLFATPAFPYAVTLYQHHISTFLILFSIYSLLRYKTPWALAIVWFSCALSISVDNPNLFLMFPIGVFALTRAIHIEEKVKQYQLNIHWAGLLTVVVMILPLAFFMYFNQMSYGNPFQLAGTAASAKNISQLHTPDLVEVGSEQLPDTEVPGKPTQSRNALSFFDTRQLPNGLYEHFLSLDRGMIMYTPVILIGFIGLLLLAKNNIAFTNLLAAIIGADVLLYSMWGDPYGGWAFGSRYMIPAYSILAILLAHVLTKYRKNLFILFTILVIGIYAVCVNTIGAVTSNRNPPKVEVLAIEAVSHVQERYTYTRNMQMLNANRSKSFVFQEFAYQYLTAWQFTELIISAISVMLLLQFAALFINRNRN